MTDQKNKQGSPGKDKKQSGNDQDPKNMPHKHSKKTMGSDDTDQEAVRKGADIENPDEHPEKKVELDDNPDETKRKIPRM